jgi:hypothetical protein
MNTDFYSSYSLLQVNNNQYYTLCSLYTRREGVTALS